MADITVASYPATIAVTATTLTVTKPVGQRGKILNSGVKTAYLGCNNGAAVVAADTTQEQYKIVLPTLVACQIPRGISGFSAICGGADVTTLAWLPEEPDV